MSIVYFFLDHYPWWAIPLALISLEVANHFRRRANRLATFAFVGLSITLIALAVVFIMYDGFAGSNILLERIQRFLISKI